MLNFQTIFESIPGLYIIISLDFVIQGGSDAYFLATKTKREEVVGRHLLDVFPDNPDDPNANGVQNLRASLESVLKHRKPHTMAVQKYDIRRPAVGDGFEERYWSAINSPVFDRSGEMTHIIQRVEDVTEFMRVQQRWEGPLKDSLSDPQVPLPAVHRDRLELVQRNGLRLLKLVNTLLDFSRIEAGRIQASYEPEEGDHFSTLAGEQESLISPDRTAPSARILLADDNAEGIAILMAEISARKQAEADLREAHVQLESAIAAGAIYTWRWKIPDDLAIVNAAFAHLFGVDPVVAATGLPIKLFVQAMHEEDRPRVVAAINQAIAHWRRICR